MPGQRAPAAASSRHRPGSDAPDSAAPGRPQSPAPATPPAQSSPSAPHRSSVSSSSSSAPSNTTERLSLQLSPWSHIRGPLHGVTDNMKFRYGALMIFAAAIRLASSQALAAVVVAPVDLSPGLTVSPLPNGFSSGDGIPSNKLYDQTQA